MPETIKIKKGLDIPLGGKPSEELTEDLSINLFGIYPDDFPGPVWKTVLKAGDEIKSGDTLFTDKESGEIRLTSPVSGVVKEVKRGERRHIEYLSIETKSRSEQPKLAINGTSVDEILKALKGSGLWAMMRQRPYDIVPEAGSTPRDIFITAFDSAPLAPGLITDNVRKWFDKGIEILSKLTSGKVYIGIKKGEKLSSPHAEVYEYEGPHPAGNVGTQIAAIKPVNKGEIVWTLDIVTAARIGRLFAENVLDYSTIVAITGPKVSNPHLVKTLIGASIEDLLKGFIHEGEQDLRIISGNVLTGIKVNADGFIHYPYRQITVINEGKEADEFMGWASLNPSKFSVKRSFPAFLRGLKKPFDFDARIKGGRRAMILSGEYDKVFPFDIYPEYLIKAILAGDIDRMEKLGIYEIAPEDFALPEFVDTSKLELQKIVRDGLDNLRKELA